MKSPVKRIIGVLFMLVAAAIFSCSAFAADAQYKAGDYVSYSGHTDFGYYYTYTDNNVNYKCFSVVTADGQRFYASVKDSLYEYFKGAFADRDITLRGAFQSNAQDGSPIVLATWEVTNDNGKEKLTEVDEYVAPLFCKDDAAPDFRLFRDLYNDATVSAADDGSYMTIDNNPLNMKGGSIIFNETGLNHVKLTNKVLGLPDWLFEEMANTRALDGRQKEVFDNVTVTWTYHPDHGLEVIYRTNN